jgi:hypothetical protein
VPYLLVSLGGIIGVVLFLGLRSITAIVAVKYVFLFCGCGDSLSLLCATLGEGVLSLSCDLVEVGWCFLVPYHANVVTRVLYVGSSVAFQNHSI